jgi:hypothetical protein
MRNKRQKCLTVIRPLAGGGGGGVGGAPTTNLGGATRNLQNIKDEHADRPSEKRAKTVPRPRVASVEPPWLETTHFQKCMYYTHIT